MTLPRFTAAASLYKTSNRYRSAGLGFAGSSTARSVVAAYHPGPNTTYRCNSCLQNCRYVQSTCEDFALAGSWSPFGPWLFAACYSDAEDCRERCGTGLGPCCPKTCGARDPYDLSAGCCDADEQCVDRYDPNSREGCCPREKIVCGGKCCAQGHSCCGETCCPPHHFCRPGGFCSDYPSDLLPPPGSPPPTPPVNNCIFGGVPCGTKCCFGGLQCCGLFNGQPVCKTSCL